MEEGLTTALSAGSELELQPDALTGSDHGVMTATGAKLSARRTALWEPCDSDIMKEIRAWPSAAHVSAPLLSSSLGHPHKAPLHACRTLNPGSWADPSGNLGFANSRMKTRVMMQWSSLARGGS